MPFTLLGGGTAGASPLLTAPRSLCGIQFNCGTVSAAPQLTLPYNGAGTISSNPPGLTCTVSTLVPPNGAIAATTSGTCTSGFTWPVTQTELTVTITSSPAVGSYTCGSSCDPTHTVPNVELLSMAAGPGTFGVLSGFVLLPEALSVSKTGVGSGKVTSQPSGIDCGATCTWNVGYGTSVTLAAVADAGATFVQWTGACNGQGSVCKLQPKSPLSTNAVFGLAGQTTSTNSSTRTTTTTTPATTTATTPATTTAAAPISTSVQPPLDAQLVAVKTVHSKLGTREVEVEISTIETASVTLSLTSAHKTLTSHTFRGVRGGDRVLSLIVPQRVGSGSALLRATIAGGVAGHRTFQATIAIPHASSSRSPS